jgi:hypothetical protein
MKIKSFLIICSINGLIFSSITLAEEIHPTIDMNQAKEITAQMPEGVTIEKNSAEASFRVQYQGNDAVFIPILEIPTSGASNCRLEYSARMRSEEGTQKAYIEMWCVVGGNPYFSKALDQIVSGFQDWKTVKTPFFLKQGENAEKAIIGVHFEGPGTVQLDRINLLRFDNTLMGGIQTNWQWIPGTVFGVLAGLYGAFTGIVAPKGKARSLVMGLGIFFECASVLLLIAGVVLWLQGQPYATWYGILLPGFIGTLVFSQIFITIPRAYAQAEMRKMRAKDIIGG